MKKVLIILLLIFVLMACMSCDLLSKQEAQRHGFCGGVWHGFISCYTMFTKQMYDFKNNEILYNLGFKFGEFLFLIIIIAIIVYIVRFICCRKKELAKDPEEMIDDFDIESMDVTDDNQPGEEY